MIELDIHPCLCGLDASTPCDCQVFNQNTVLDPNHAINLLGALVNFHIEGLLTLLIINELSDSVTRDLRVDRSEDAKLPSLQFNPVVRCGRIDLNIIFHLVFLLSNTVKARLSDSFVRDASGDDLVRSQCLIDLFFITDSEVVF